MPWGKYIRRITDKSNDTEQSHKDWGNTPTMSNAAGCLQPGGIGVEAVLEDGDGAKRGTRREPAADHLIN